MNYWLVKSEPETYSWADLVKEHKTVWSGVRNYQARNNLKAMAKGDPVFFYHSGEEKQIVGLAQVAKEFYPDPTAKEGDWVCVDIASNKPLAKPVTLGVVKADKALNEMVLAHNSRLSVSPVSERQFQRVLELSSTRI